MLPYIPIHDSLLGSFDHLSYLDHVRVMFLGWYSLFHFRLRWLRSRRAHYVSWIHATLHYHIRHRYDEGFLIAFVSSTTRDHLGQSLIFVVYAEQVSGVRWITIHSSTDRVDVFTPQQESMKYRVVVHCDHTSGLKYCRLLVVNFRRLRGESGNPRYIRMVLNFDSSACWQTCELQGNPIASWVPIWVLCGIEVNTGVQMVKKWGFNQVIVKYEWIGWFPWLRFELQ